MGAKKVAAAFAIALTLAAGVGCSAEPPAPASIHTGFGAPAAPPLPPRPGAPTTRFPVGVRSLAFARGADRPLPTLVWYPAAAGRPGAVARRDVVAARGRFPLVLFSHGLGGRPQRLAGLAQAWAAAGFVVAAPSYPHTNWRAAAVDRADVDNQPADAAYVVDQLRRLNATPGDVLAARVDGDWVAAVGHSAGGYTTTGMFTDGHDPRLRAGVVIAGWLAPGAFAGPAATLLFVHGDRDHIVPDAAGRAAYDQAQWPKSFRLLRGRWHSEYLRPGQPGFIALRDLVTDFLRWTLYGDEAAHRRLPPDGPPPADPATANPDLADPPPAGADPAEPLPATRPAGPVGQAQSRTWADDVPSQAGWPS